jgi:CheY-like chemotaxis protein
MDILIVEDEPEIAKLIQMTLEREGFLANGVVMDLPLYKYLPTTTGCNSFRFNASGFGWLGGMCQNSTKAWS